MFDDLKSVLKHFLVYGAGNILNRLVGFILIPLYTHYLDPAEYGKLELLELTTYVIAFLVGAGISQSVLRFYYGEKESLGRNRVVSSALIADLVLSAVAFVVLWITSPWFAGFILDGADQGNLFRMVFLIMTFSIASEVPMAYIRAQQQSTLYSIVSISRLILSLSLNLIFIIPFHMGIFGILLSSVISGGLAATALIVYTLRRTGLHFSVPHLRDIMRYGLPYIPGGLGLYVINFADRFFLKRFGTLDDVGIYSLGYKFGMIINPVLIDPFLSIWRPKVFELEGKEHANRFYSLMLTYFTLVAVFVSLGIAVMIEDVASLLSGPGFQAAYRIVPIILLSYLLSGMHFQLQVGILITKRTRFIAVIVGSAAVANLILNYTLIPRYGIWGAAYATLGTFVIMNVLNYMISQRLYRVTYEWVRIAKLAVAAVFLYGLANVIQIDSTVLSLLVRGLVAMSFPLVLWLLRFYHPEEIAKLKELALVAIRRVLPRAR